MASSITPSRFAKHLKENGFDSRRGNEDAHGFVVTYIDLTATRIRVGRYLPVLVPQRGQDGLAGEELDEAIDAAAAYTRSSRANFVVLASGASAEPHQHHHASKSGVVIFEPADMVAVCDARRGPAKEQAVVRVLVRRLGRRALSPYVGMGQPAFGTSFFGRASTLDRLVGRNAPSLTIMGNRRIGKTSLLRELSRRLRIAYEDSVTADLYASNCHSTYDVIRGLLEGITTRGAQNLAPHEVHRFPTILRQLAASGQIYFFIDEADRLIEFDKKQQFECLNLLRAATEQGSCRVFFAGFRRIMAAREQQDTPLFNFTKAETLAGLSQADTTEMVIRPLLNLGIDMRRTDVAATIYRETGGYPELIQMFCEELIEIYESIGAIPKDAELLEKVFTSSQFQSKIFGTFLGSTNALEQLAAYLLIREAGHQNIETFEFERDDVARVLTDASLDLGYPGAWKIARHLETGGVIAQVGGTRRLKFSVPQLARYCMNIDLDRCIASAQRQARSGDMIAQLESEPHEISASDSARDVS
ncbi:MAG TPA: AAA family ATPase [Kofleriaceae bacterium]|jgi:uncharacterized protein (DUF1778 family)